MGTEQQHWVIKIGDEVNKMRNNPLSEAEHWQKRCIYKLPANITDINKNAYTPDAVSFGPYHHGEQNLMPMEEHKHRALIHFVMRSEKPLHLYMESLSDVAQDLKDSYDSLDPAWHIDTDRFLQFMMLDGCFMLEIVRFATRTGYEKRHIAYYYAENDPIFSIHGMLNVIPFIMRDMLKLENQLPMLLLKKLIAVEDDGTKVENLILRLFYFRTWSPTDTSADKCLHVLDVYMKGLIQEVPQRKKLSQQKMTSRIRGDGMTRSAMELNEAGIKFSNSNSRSLRDISFENGVLRLPLIMVDDTTKSVFLNLIAFEKFHVGLGNEVTSYIFFMSTMIKSARDVSLLHSCGIIENQIGNEEDVANLFSSISKDITIEPYSSLDIVRIKVNSSHKRPWHKWRANLIHTYFTSPWTILSVVAAIFLFAHTTVQTAYTVHPPK